METADEAVGLIFSWDQFNKPNTKASAHGVWLKN